MTLGWELVTTPDAENPVINDVRVVNGKIQRLADRKASIAQACTVVLNWWFGDSPYDTSRGVRWLDILGQSPSEAMIRALVARALISVRGVLSVTMDIDIGAGGDCEITNLVVRTDSGNVEVDGSFGPTRADSTGGA